MGTLEGIGLGLDCRLPINTLISAFDIAEEKGFRAAWTFQYHFFRDPFVVLGAIAVRTSRMLLGTGITTIHERHPLTVAMCAASIQEISGGRMLLGLGRGVSYELNAQMGIPYSKPLEALREAVPVIRDFLSGKKVDFKGRVFRIDGASLGFSCKPPIPLYLAAMGPKALKVATEVADGVILNYGASVDYVSHAVNMLRKLRKNRSFDIASVVWVVPELNEKTLDLAREALASFYSIPGWGEALLPFTEYPVELVRSIRRYYCESKGRLDIRSAARLIPEELVRSVMIVGENDAKQRLAEYRNAGVEHVILAPIGGPVELRKTIEVFS